MTPIGTHGCKIWRPSEVPHLRKHQIESGWSFSGSMNKYNAELRRRNQSTGGLGQFIFPLNKYLSAEESSSPCWTMECWIHLSVCCCCTLRFLNPCSNFYSRLCNVYYYTIAYALFVKLQVSCRIVHFDVWIEERYFHIALYRYYI